MITCHGMCLAVPQQLLTAHPTQVTNQTLNCWYMIANFMYKKEEDESLEMFKKMYVNKIIIKIIMREGMIIN